MDADYLRSIPGWSLRLGVLAVLALSCAQLHDPIRDRLAGLVGAPSEAPIVLAQYSPCPNGKCD